MWEISCLSMQFSVANRRGDHPETVYLNLTAQEAWREEHAAPYTHPLGHLPTGLTKFHVLNRAVSLCSISLPVNHLHVITLGTESQNPSPWKWTCISYFITFLQKHDSESCRHFQPFQENVDVSSLYPKHSYVCLLPVVSS